MVVLRKELLGLSLCDLDLFDNYAACGSNIENLDMHLDSEEAIGKWREREAGLKKRITDIVSLVDAASVCQTTSGALLASLNRSLRETRAAYIGPAPLESLESLAAPHCSPFVQVASVVSVDEVEECRPDLILCSPSVIPSPAPVSSVPVSSVPVSSVPVSSVPVSSVPVFPSSDLVPPKVTCSPSSVSIAARPYLVPDSNSLQGLCQLVVRRDELVESDPLSLTNAATQQFVASVQRVGVDESIPVPPITFLGRVNGVRALFNLDTAASHTFISPAFAEQLGVPLVENVVCNATLADASKSSGCPVIQPV
jgi:hypothetical protein